MNNTNNGETAKAEMGLGIESIKINNTKQDGVYRHRKRKFGRTYINILHDPRVVRGNTYAAFVIPSSLQMEFIRLKEEEERRKRMMKIPKKLPRVALLAQKKAKEEEYFEEAEKQQEEPDSPQYKHLDNPENIPDIPYFFEDRPPTPKFIPLPPGIEVATQIEDGELFDYDLEVAPILQVLVGRSLVQAQYELIEEEERREYLKHKKKYEQEREFELINLQRTEAAYKRREFEKERRQNQINFKKLRDIEIQKKLMCKMFAKTNLSIMTRKTVNQLYERGILKDTQPLKLTKLIQRDYYPVTDKINLDNLKIENLLNEILPKQKIKKLALAHKSVVDKDKQRIQKILDDKEAAIKLAEENERKRIEEKAKRTENRRRDRILKSITDNILSSRTVKTDILNIPLADIDEITFKNESLHCLGGQFGLTVIVLDQILRMLAENQIITQENLNLPEVFRNFIEEVLLNQLKETQSFELRYMESKKYDFTQPPENDEKRKEFLEFLLDNKRIVNKSLKTLIESEYVSDYVYRIFIETIANLYFEKPQDPAGIEIDPENQEPQYLESIKKKQEEMNKYNIKLEKLKKKIKLNFVKGDSLKKKVDNIGGFIMVKPNLRVMDSINEIEEIPLPPKEEIKPLEEGHSEIDKIKETEVKQTENPHPTQEDQEKNDKTENEAKNNQNNNSQQDHNSQNTPRNSSEEIPKAEQLITKIEFINEAEVFKNYSIPIDSYILHLEASEWFTSLTVVSLRRVLKSHYNITLDLLQTIAQAKEKIKNMENWMVQYILQNEKYKGKSILPLEVIPVEPVVDVEGEHVNKSQEEQKDNSNSKELNANNSQSKD